MLIGHETGKDDDDTNDNRGLVKYIIHDEDAQHRLATHFQLQHIRIISCNIPLEWYKEYVHVFLIAAVKYDVYRKPHIVLMKAIAHSKYGPDVHTWTHITTKDFSRDYVRTKLSRYHGWMWKITGHLVPNTSQMRSKSHSTPESASTRLRPCPMQIITATD
ncbi:hypothetical protein JTB14_029824 [Gonioctena quinquepunctata]|nr:hypothetical protein JTB14_029824 [Gonioctena quinquepunctata]